MHKCYVYIIVAKKWESFPFKINPIIFSFDTKYKSKVSIVLKRFLYIYAEKGKRVLLPSKYYISYYLDSVICGLDGMYPFCFRDVNKPYLLSDVVAL